MNRAGYLDFLESIKLEKKIIEGKHEEGRKAYIESNKPCDIGDNVEITLNSGRKLEGVVAELGILRDQTVCVTAVNVGGKNAYITVPHKEVKVLI